MADIDDITALLIDEFTNDDLFDQAIRNQNIFIDIPLTLAGISDKEESARIEGYVEEVIPLYSTVDFKSHFCMNRSTFGELCTEMAPLMNKERTLTLEKKLLATIWILATPECYRRSVADRFGYFTSRSDVSLSLID